LSESLQLVQARTHEEDSMQCTCGGTLDWVGDWFWWGGGGKGPGFATQQGRGEFQLLLLLLLLLLMLTT